MTIVCGIDLGHDQLRVAALVEERPVAVATLPAWVGFDGATVLVGAAARALPLAQRVQPRAWLGRAAGQGDRAAIAGPAGLACPIVDGQPRAPAELVGWLLRAAIQAAEAEHGPVIAAVIAAPVYAGAVERRVLRDAALLAGIPMVRLCGEPVLAALALPAPPDARWLVCDAGSTAFTASVIELVGGAVDRLSTASAVELGGDALDGVIATELARELGGVARDDHDWPHLWRAARAVKEHVGTAAATEAAFAEALTGASPGARSLRAPRKDEVELWSAPRVRKVDDVCTRALTAAGTTANDLAEVVLVGGGARVTSIARRLGQVLARAPRQPADVGFAVALGGAAAARMFVAEPAALLVDVVTYGISMGAGDRLVPLIAAGAVVPTRAARVIPTHRVGQDALEVELWEDTTPPRALGRYRIGGLPPAPAGDALALCTVAIDGNGIPALTATELVNGAALTVTPLVEAGLDAATLAERRPIVAEWRP